MAFKSSTEEAKGFKHIKSRTEEVKGFKVISEEIISDTKAIRVSQVDASETPYPFVVEIFSKKSADEEYIYKYDDGFKTLEEAQNYSKKQV